MPGPSQLILGNSAAALSAARAIRELDPSCPITIVSAEPVRAYSPVLLTYVLKGLIAKDGLFIVEPQFYEDLCLETVFADPAVSVDTSAQVVVLQSGRRLEYDNLLVATGAEPILFGDRATRPSNVCGLRTIADLDTIMRQNNGAQDVIVIGGGLVGLQCADSLSRPGRKPMIIEGLSQLLPEAADAKAAAMLLERAQARGIRVWLDTKVLGFEHRGGRTAVVCESGQEVLGDLILVGVGVRPNMKFLQDSEITLDCGVVIDDRMRTNCANVYAAGDVSVGHDILSGKNAHIPKWTNAARQGRVAGRNMAGLEQYYEGGLRETVTSVFGISFSAVGLSRPPEGVELEEIAVLHPERSFYRKFLLQDNRLVGALMVKDVNEQTIAPLLRGNGMAAALIRRGKDISPWRKQLMTGSLDLRALLPYSEPNLDIYEYLGKE